MTSVTETSASRSKTTSKVLKLTYSAMCLALAMVLPSLTMHIPQIGTALCPMHLPALLCGFLCGWPWGLAVGVISPILRSLTVGMPPMFPTAVSMAVEMGVYGAIAGLMYAKLPKKTVNIYLALIIAMVVGRLAWGLTRYLIAGLQHTSFTLEAFWAGAVAGSVPGIIVQIILVPLLVLAMEKANLVLNKKKA